MRANSIRLIAAILLLGAGILIGTNFRSDADSGAKPGSVDDPVVTKSYVDQQLNALKQQVGSGGAGTGTGMTTPPPASAGDDYAVVELPAGKTLIGKAGAEFVLRSGSATVFSADKDGISDLTAGGDLKNGDEIARNHLLLIPRDGRGMKNNTAALQYVIVRGSYAIN